MTAPRQILALAAVALLATTAGAQQPTAFTYQGRLASDGEPLTGTIDLEAALFDAAQIGNQIGTTVTVDGVAVSDGRLHVELDFGPVFSGAAVWLELAVRPEGGSAFTTLEPRTELTRVPYAAYASAAHSADLTIETTLLGGLNAGDLLDWTQLTGVPGELSDGDNDTAPSLGCAEGELARWSGTDWVCEADAGVTFARTAVVGPVGDPIANGTALLSALAGMPTLTDPQDAWRLRVEPGRYDLGSQSLVMRPFIDIAGSGRTATAIVSGVCGSTAVWPPAGAVSASADMTELRALTVESSCASPVGTAKGVAVSVEGNDVRLTDLLLRSSGSCVENDALVTTGDRIQVRDVRAIAFGASAMNCGMEIQGSFTALERSEAEGRGGTTTVGASFLGPGTTARRSRFEAAEVTSTGYALQIFAPRVSAGIGVSDCRAFAAGSGSAEVTSVYARTSGSDIRMQRLVASGDDFGIVVHDDLLDGALVVLEDVHTSSAGWGLQTIGDGDLEVWIHGGLIEGGAISVGDAAGSSVTVHLSGTGLEGATILSVTSTCTSVTNAVPAFFATTCP